MAVNDHPAMGEKRGRGRPKKDEVVCKPFIVHRDPRIKPENEVKYAEEAIRNATNLYKRYRKPYPNPLNIDVKDLLPEARAVWDYMFSLREFTMDDVQVNHRHEQCIRDGEEVLIAFEAYTDYIRKNNFVREFERPDGSTGLMPIIPNQTNLARWLGVSYMNISKAMDRSVDKAHCYASYKKMLADCLSEGAMAGIYQSSSTTFALKNLCDWADKYEDRSTKKEDNLAVDEAVALIEKLGYSRPKLGGGESGPSLPSPADD